VIEIVPGEEEESWNAGFYVIEKAPLSFEDSLANSASLPAGSV